MNKTVYLRDEEVPVWERARELSGDKLSPVIVAALKRFIADSEAKRTNYDRIEVSYRDRDNSGLPKRKAFYGNWIFPPEKPENASDEDGTNYYCALAITAKGAVVTLSWLESEHGTTGKRFRVHESMADAAASPDSTWAAIAAQEKIGVPIEELDI